MEASTADEKTVRNYEVGYLIAPTVPAEEAESLAEELADSIADTGGEMMASAAPEMRELAYTMEVTDTTGDREFDNAQFGWMQFELATDELDAVEKIFKREGDVIRHLLIKIDEDTIGKSEAEITDDEDSAEEEAAEADTEE